MKWNSKDKWLFSNTQNIEIFTAYNCDGSCRRNTDLFLCQNKCQSILIPCEGFCSTETYLNCDNECSSVKKVIESFDDETWMCDGKCQNMTQPCNGQCLGIDSIVNCNGVCHFRDDVYYCNRNCQTKDIPCNGFCLRGYLTCFNTCSSTSFSKGKTPYLCNGKCQEYNLPCNGRCQAKNFKVSCNGVCEYYKHPTVQLCNGVCQDLNMPCNGTCNEKYVLNCNNKCVLAYKTKNYMCEGKCLTINDPCNGKCYNITSKFHCNGKCQDERVACNGKCPSTDNWALSCDNICEKPLQQERKILNKTLFEVRLSSLIFLKPVFRALKT